MPSSRAVVLDGTSQSRIEIRCEQALPADGLPASVGAATHTISEDRRVLSVTSANPARTIVDLVKWIDQNGLDLADIHLKRPTLEDVFIELTGKKLRE